MSMGKEEDGDRTSGTEDDPTKLVTMNSQGIIPPAHMPNEISMANVGTAQRSPLVEGITEEERMIIATYGDEISVQMPEKTDFQGQTSVHNFQQGVGNRSKGSYVTDYYDSASKPSFCATGDNRSQDILSGPSDSMRHTLNARAISKMNAP